MSLLTARQSVMSYSWDKRVDALTLAVFADLGWYQVHWERADCTNTWGKHQGCAFLESRCGVMRRDRSVVVSDASECDGSSLWGASDEPLLAERCEFGNDPCAGGAGFDAATMRCDAQCASPRAADAECAAAANRTTRRTPPRHVADDDDDDDDTFLGLGEGDAWLLLQLTLLLVVVWGVGLALYSTWGVVDYEGL